MDSFLHRLKNILTRGSVMWEQVLMRNNQFRGAQVKAVGKEKFKMVVDQIQTSNRESSQPLQGFRLRKPGPAQCGCQEYPEPTAHLPFSGLSADAFVSRKQLLWLTAGKRGPAGAEFRRL